MSAQSTLLPKLSPEAKEHVALWLQDLRSGEYLQGNGRLHAPEKTEESVVDAYCCLGVGCITFHKHTGQGEWVRYSGQDDKDFEVSEYLGDTLLPEPVSEWLGFSDDDERDVRIVYEPKKWRDLGIFDDEQLKALDEGTQNKYGAVGEGDLIWLSALNDTRACTFEQIAALVEHYYLSEDNDAEAS